MAALKEGVGVVAGCTAEILDGVVGIILKEDVVDVTTTLRDGIVGVMFILVNGTHGAKYWVTLVAATHCTLS